MITIQDQLKLEKEMLDIGRRRYHANENKKEEKGRTSETSYAQRLVGDVVTDVADALDNLNTRSVAGRELKGTDKYKAALIGLRTMFDTVTTDMSLQTCAGAIGARIEDDIHFTQFEQEHEEYYDRVIEKFKEDNTVSYRHRHRVLTHLSAKNEVAFEPWGPTKRTHVGMAIMNAVMTYTELFTKETVRTRSSITSTVVRIKLTPEASDWIEAHKDKLEFMRPERLPFIIPPAEWTSMTEGGYYHGLMRKRTPLVKFKNQAHQLLLTTQMDDTKLRQTVNAIQKTPYRVNKDVLQTMRTVWEKNLGTGMPATDSFDIPPCPFDRDTWTKDEACEEEVAEFNRWKREASLMYTADRERSSKCLSVHRAMDIARRYEDVEQFYYTYQADFRGRLYAVTPILNPQGADFSKGLIEFATSKPLGATGGHWLCVHGSNVYGNDKVSYDDRERFIREELNDACISVASDPIAHRDVWGNADKPWQFLAFCFEYKRWADSGFSTDFESNTAVALDGTCNGLQHFSAMLRDASGGAATNLTNADVPADIYGVVAEVVNGKLEALRDAGDENAIAWLLLGINRKCTKRPVMTLPYGATKTSCREYIEDYIYETGGMANDLWPEAYDKFRASYYLHHIVWAAMEETLVASMAAMEYLQKSSRIVSKRNDSLTWTAPNGFLVHQNIMLQKGIRIDTQLMGRLQVRLCSDTDDINSRKQALGVAPNFVHSHDASHMYDTVIDADANGVTSYWLVHDSYGTHACDAAQLNASIRITFHDMYADSNPIEDFAITNDVLGQIPLPEIGELVLADVLEADYFFG